VLPWVAMKKRTRALICGPGGRVAADAALLRPLGGRMVLEFNHVHTVVVEHAFTIAERGCVRGNLELLGEIATKLPDLWTCGICAPRSSSRGSGLSHDHLHTARLRPPSPQARSPGKVHTRADASIVRRPAPGAPGGRPISARLESRSRAQDCYR